MWKKMVMVMIVDEALLWDGAKGGKMSNTHALWYDRRPSSGSNVVPLPDCLSQE